MKPENLMMRTGSNKIYIVDFGLSKRYMTKDPKDEKKLTHIPIKDGHQLTGTPRYASVNAHMGLEQSRRDDLESLVYVLVFLLRSSLPWCGIKANNKH